MWGATNEEELQELADAKVPYSTEELIEELRRRGAIKIVNDEKEKELKSATDQSVDSSPHQNHFSSDNNTHENEKSQGVDERNMHKNQAPDINKSYKPEHEMSFLKEYYNYDVMIADEKQLKADIDMIMNIIYDVMNATYPTIRIKNNDMPLSTVQSRIWKLNYEDLYFVLDNFYARKQNTSLEPIKNPTNYLITQLHQAKREHRASNIGNM